MSKWTKVTAKAELTALIKEIPKLSHQTRFSADHARWVVRTLSVLEEIFGRVSRYYHTFASYLWHETFSFQRGGPRHVERIQNPQNAVERRHRDAYIRQLQSAKKLLHEAFDELERSDLDSVHRGKDPVPESSTIFKLLNLSDRKLRKAIGDKPPTEKEIQDAFESLLIGGDIPYLRETDSVEYSSKTYTPDFTLPKIDLALGIKLCGKAGTEKEIIAEIQDDIIAYETKYGNQMFVIYDCGFTGDMDLIVRAFEEKPNVVLRVVEH